VIWKEKEAGSGELTQALMVELVQDQKEKACLMMIGQDLWVLVLKMNLEEK